MASAVDNIPVDVPSDEGLDDYDSDHFDEPLSDDSDVLTWHESDTDSFPERGITPPLEENIELIALTAEVDTLCSQATKELDRLPRKTRNKLTPQTREIFKSYEQHGSQQRLANALEKFLIADDEGLDFTLQPSPLTPKPQASRNIDPESAPIVRNSPFHAADLEFEIAGDISIPPYLLPALDRIFSLYSLEARALLKHHCEKYGDEPIFRAGIREYMQSQLRGVLEATQDDSLSITPENRAFLRSAYERSPDINLAEKRMLARATRLGLETIEMFWEDMNVRRRAYMGMRQFVAARELEKVREEEKEVEEELKSGFGKGLGRR